MTEEENISSVEIFCSYAQHDEDLAQKLVWHFSGLRRYGLIQSIYSHEAGSGKHEKEEINQYLHNAVIVLLLISPFFLTSEYLHGEELQTILEKYKKREIYAIPVLLRTVEWKETPLGKLEKALPANEEPVVTWPDIDEAFVDIAKGVHEIINRYELAQKGDSIVEPLPISLIVPLAQLVNGREILALSLEGKDLAANLDDHFPTIVVYYSRDLRQFCRRYVGDDSADEMVQQTMLNVYAAFSGALKTENGLQWLQALDLVPYLFAVARQECYEYLNQMAGVPSNQSTTTFANPWKQIKLHRDRSDIIHTLPPVHQKAARLLFEERVNSRQAARQLNIREDTVKLYQKHTRNLLHKFLDPTSSSGGKERR